MNKNRMFVLAAVALILSGAVTYLAFRALQARLSPPDTTTKIVVAAKRADLGYRLTKEDLMLVSWPSSSPLEGSFSDPALVEGRAVLIPLQANEPILESKLAPKEAGAGLTAVIPEGKRALTIQVNSIIGVSGFVVPGTRVDLILTTIPPAGVKGAKPNETASKIILENLEVLAAGQNVQRDVDGKPQNVQDVTFLLTPEDAERVALATGEGRIQLALRNRLDNEVANPPIVSRTHLYTPPGETIETKAPVREKPPVYARRAPAPVVAAAPPPPPKPAVLVIELIQGAKRANETFEEKKATEEKKPFR
jgi:pilus assembly protein CpaB